MQISACPSRLDSSTPSCEVGRGRPGEVYGPGATGENSSATFPAIKAQRKPRSRPDKSGRDKSARARADRYVGRLFVAQMRPCMHACAEIRPERGPRNDVIALGRFFHFAVCPRSARVRRILQGTRFAAAIARREIGSTETWDALFRKMWGAFGNLDVVRWEARLEFGIWRAFLGLVEKCFEMMKSSWTACFFSF